MSRTWLSIRVELVEGSGQHFWPRPGRILAGARTHTFAQLADAIDDAFARWDRAHLHEFTLADGTPISPLKQWDGEQPEDMLDGDHATLSRLKAAEQFVYVFDLGDSWTHLCTVAKQRIDPIEQLGITPDQPLPYTGWGNIPDQYGRRWDGDDGETTPPPDPGLADLPPLQPWWGPQAQPPHGFSG